MDLGFGVCKGGTLACLWTAPCWLAVGVSSLMLHSDAPLLAAHGCEHVAARLWPILLTYPSILSLVYCCLSVAALCCLAKSCQRGHCLTHLAILSRITADIACSNWQATT